MSNINPTAVIVVALCGCIGAMGGYPFAGLAAGLLIILVAEMIG